MIKYFKNTWYFCFFWCKALHMSINLTKNLLQWYDLYGRDLPWRFKGGAHPTPYVVLVSEIMLQQTTVKTVLPYFERFMNRFPTVEALAAAPLEEVYLYWQGLGYYTRARSLHTTAEMIMRDFGGKFPVDKENVKKLKGLGAYTVASFLALAFNQPETVVDGNVIRIISRLYHLKQPVEEIMPLIREKAEMLTDKENPADYASAIMDLGALICTPKKPQCLLCPWQEACFSYGKDDIEDIPRRVKAIKKEINGFVYVIRNKNGEVLIRKRIEKGLLSGLYEFPWSESLLFENARKSGLTVMHVFTHIKMRLEICFVYADAFADGFFVKVSDLESYPFSTLMKKVWQKSLL